MKRIALLDPTLVKTIVRQLPFPNNTRTTWQQTVNIFKQHDLYRGERVKALERDIESRYKRAAGGRDFDQSAM